MIMLCTLLVLFDIEFADHVLYMHWRVRGIYWFAECHLFYEVCGV